ncbi:hypothetical protein F4680DRAFT_433940 [Xylaria scruposa]|nr:hypothetical protein F4680DRAFT_433940 [Xylaria scruposa]
MEEFFLDSVAWEASYDLNSDITLYILHHGALFRICYVARKLASLPSALEQHHESYKILYRQNLDEKILVAERLRKPFEELMNRLAPTISTESIRSLHSYLYPPSFILDATIKESHIEPCFRTTVSRWKFVCSGEYVDNNDCFQPHLPSLASKVDVYSSRRIQVLAHTTQLVPSKVSVDGVTYFFKPWLSGRGHGYHELRSHDKILVASEANPSSLCNAYICRLHGLIIDDDDDVLQHYQLHTYPEDSDEDSDEDDSDTENCDEDKSHGTRLVGLLLTYIENRGTMHYVAPWPDCTNEERTRWSRQIRESVQTLHAAGVVWGDAKTDNVLIGKDGNAYLIDFGGSYTQGWVDKDKMETVEGDLQGLKRIEEWLVHWSENPITFTQAEK